MTGRTYVRRDSWLHAVVPAVVVATLIAPLSPILAATQHADRICRQNSSSATAPVNLYLGISHGLRVIGAPINQMDDHFSRCQLARWNEPKDGKDRMIAFVYNNSSNATFRDARVIIRATGVGPPASSRRVSIGSKVTGVFLFVGKVDKITIALRGIYGGRNLRFAARALPAGCGSIKLNDALTVIEAFEPTSTLRSRLPNPESEERVYIVRIQLHDAIFSESGADLPATEAALLNLSEDNANSAFIECS